MGNKEKRVVQIEIDDEVKKLTIEGSDKDQNVVMREELSEDDLDNVTGGSRGGDVCIGKGKGSGCSFKVS
ncbi:MAG: bacteriocin [Bacteroidaceae bacterium]|nr:bacteriocin [Bacteroidaceae bacterium]